MKNTHTHGKKQYTVKRYPTTELSSLQAWNAADEYILEHFDSQNTSEISLAIYNDRFGFLTCFLYESIPKVIINYASQKKAIVKNLENNQLSKDQIKFIKPLENALEKINIAIVKIPKSMDLFRLQLMQIARSLDKNGIVLCGFMTKYFTKQMLTIANEYFENVEQSLARKKSRVLILQKPKPEKDQNIIKSILFEDTKFQQYFGVFSARNIDFASQFFIKNWRINEDAERVLDLASGNGFLGKMIRMQNPDCEIHLLDDDRLAIESSKLNFENRENTYFHFSDSLESFDDGYFDLIVCNPPFHFEYENNIEVAIDLFKQAKRCLSEQGSFQLVANRHLNYKTHLVKLFNKVEIVRKNKKFEIYECMF